MSTTALTLGCLFLAAMFAFVAYLLKGHGGIDHGWINDTVGREHEGWGGIS